MTVPTKKLSVAAKKSGLVAKPSEGNAQKAESMFYLERIVEDKMKQNSAMRKNEFNAIEKNCEKIEAKDKKYIDALKDEMLRKYKAEQDRSQRKIEKIKRKAIQRIEERMKAEERKIEELCKKEVCMAMDKTATKIGWFQLSVLLYRAYPDFFGKNNNKG